MIRPLVAICVLATVAEAASTKYEDYKGDSYGKQESHEDNKYDHDYKMKKQVAFARTYKQEPQYYEEKYYRPIYKVYEVPKYVHRGGYRSYGDGGDSYGKSYSPYKPSSYRKDKSTSQAVQDIKDKLTFAQLIAEEQISAIESGNREVNHNGGRTGRCHPCPTGPFIPCTLCCSGASCIPCDGVFNFMPLCINQCCE